MIVECEIQRQFAGMAVVGNRRWINGFITSGSRQLLFHYQLPAPPKLLLSPTIDSETQSSNLHQHYNRLCEIRHSRYTQVHTGTHRSHQTLISALAILGNVEDWQGSNVGLGRRKLVLASPL